jgi:acetolactate synthase-1/2/3 large subunit
MIPKIPVLAQKEMRGRGRRALVLAHVVQLGGIDWEKLAQSFGVDGVTVETEQALANALQAALKSKRTTVVGVRIDASGYVAQFNALREL